MMKVLVLFGVFMGLLFGGLILACIKTTDAMQIQMPPLDRHDDIFEASEEENIIPAVKYPLGDGEIENYMTFLQSKTTNNQIKPSDNIRSFTKNLLQQISKRTAFATSREELNQLTDVNNNEIVGGGIGLQKRSQQKEYHVGGCEAKIDWIFLNRNHFPRFIKSYQCTSTTCGLAGECRPKRYPVYVLRMNTPDNISVLDEGCDTHLPEELRCDWKLVQINVTTYCECFTDGITSLNFGR